MYSLGVDVGGTFTDLVLIDTATKKILYTKTPSTPSSPDQGVINGIEKVMNRFGVKPEQIHFLIHGTTVATNALIERKGTEAALIVTKGFRDVLHIARQIRPKLYDFFQRRPDPFIPRHLRYEVGERVLYTGAIKEPLNEDDVRFVARDIVERGIKVVVVCLLHSYANPAHEKRIEALFAEAAPDVRVVLSAEVLPEFKEYERMSTTVINAYVMPIVERYLRRIMDSLETLHVKSDLHIMQSNGGLMSWETASQKSVHTVLSGPAGGVLGAVKLANMISEDNIITIDMGGTSFDVCLSFRGKPTFTVESDIDGHVIKVPMIDIKTLGAGGGSIAWIDAGGGLQVGPQSAGADPGPACYNRGGALPTVTDANLVLGYLNPDYFLGGEMKLHLDLARQAIQDKIAEPLGLGLAEAAMGIIRVVNAEMIRGIRLVSVERGFDPRDFALECFGGAGPVHAVKLAQELNIPKIIVPIGPGVTCALGLLMADFRHDYSKTFFHGMWELDPNALNTEFKALERKALEQMVRDGVSAQKVEFHRSMDMRYAGQGYELEVSVAQRDYAAQDLKDLCHEFTRIHTEQYGYGMPPETVEIVNLRLTAIGVLPKPDMASERFVKTDPAGALKGHRRAFFDGEFRNVPLYERTKLHCGNEIMGPAIIEQLDSTTVVWPGCRVLVDSLMNLKVTVIQ